MLAQEKRRKRPAYFYKISLPKVCKFSTANNKFKSNQSFSVRERTFEGLRRLKEDIDPRYFWVSLRSDNTKTVNSFRDYLDFEVYDF